MLCNRRIQRHDERGSGRQSRAAGPSKSRSVSIARKCGSTSSQDQPGNAQPVEVLGQRAAEIAAVDRPGTADHCAAHDVSDPLRFVGQCRHIVPNHRAGGTDRHPHRVGDLRAHPRVGRARSRLDNGDMTTRIARNMFCKHRSGTPRADDQHIAVQDAASGPDLRLEGADVPFPNHSGPQAGAVGDVVEALQQQIADQPDGLGVIVCVSVPLHPVHDPVDDGRDQHHVPAAP